MHYVCSDIHGQDKLYMEMLKQLDLKEDDTLYVLGDVVDRGPGSIPILQDMMKRKNVEFFLGNHELMMLDYLYQRINGHIWHYPQNGGTVTNEAYQRLPKEEQEAILSYIEQSWVQKYIDVEGEKYALHHSYFLPGKAGEDVRYYEELDDQAVFDAVWNSPYRFWEYAPESEYDDGCIHIIGHVPVQSQNKKNPPLYGKILKKKLIDIDGGCSMLFFGKKGGLYCMSLETDADGKRKEIWLEGEPSKN